MTISAVAIRPEEARRELARRELARRQFIHFESYVAPYYRPARHHYLVAEYLELVLTYIRTRGRTGIGRLIVMEPPRYGKSEQVSRHFPAWVLGHLPDARIIVTSYGLDLASDFSRAARDIVAGDRYANVFGPRATVEREVMLSSDSRSVRSWDLAAPNRGGLVAAGVGGGITGKGAHLLIVDDPLKNREEAESESHRESVWEWWTSTAYTRLEDGAAVVVMLTRWHGDDLAGRLMRLMASDPLADQWVVLCLPAIWEPTAPEGKTFDEYAREKMLEGVWLTEKDELDRQPGEALWPEKYSTDDLMRIRRNIGEYDFQALYQQMPYIRSGNYFKPSYFPVVDAVPDPSRIVKRVRYWDKAGTAGGGDYSAGVLMCLTTDGTIYVEHVARGQWSPGQREEEILKTAQQDLRRPGRRVETWHQQDPGSAGLESAQATNRKLAAAGITAHYEPVTGDKEVRAGPWSSACESGQVRLVRGGWNQAFIDEHVAFPKGLHDDQVDAASSAFMKLNGRRGSGIHV